MDSKTMDIVAENVSKLKELFPEAFTEGKVDFEALKEVLGEYVDGREERYSFTWNGKSKARMIAQTSSAGTLRPCKDESVDWETTKNLFIEGDNLEVLKLLQKSYHKKVKMIYIDPPYNTGNDFVYKDDFRDNIKNYKEITGQVDNEGRNLSSNAETSGRYHTDWLNMMYPRLKLARNLLKDDGVIFISIDEIEYSKLRMICDEIFGEENHIADFVWQNKKGGGNDAKYVAVEHEYIVMYAKNEVSLHNLFEPYKAEYLKRYKEQDDLGKFFWDTFKRKSGKQYYPITAPDGTTLQFDENGNPISWLRSEDRFYRDLEDKEVRFVGGAGKWSVQFKQRLPAGKKPRSIFLSDSIWDSTGTTSEGSSDVFSLFGKDVFDNPKPLKLLKKLIGFNLNESELILDFFAGSSTSAHAIFIDNLLNEINRNFIMVQLPAPIEDKTEAGKNAQSLNFKSLSKLSIERIRRVSKKIKTENPEYQGDLGFKVFKLDSTNIKPWELDFDLTEQDLEDQINNIKYGRTEEDVLYEVLLKYGLDLTLPITEHSIAGHKVFDIGMGALIICLSDDISLEVVEGIAKLKKELNPEIMRVVFKDSGFANDVVKTNAVQILKQAGIEDARSL